MPGIRSTLAFIKEAHGDQLYGSEPYWTHPKQVADVGRRIFGKMFTKDAVLVALLHDVIEDTPYTPTDLYNLGYVKLVVDPVELVTKDKTLTYMENIRRITSSRNTLAMMVKYSDNYVNFSGDKSSWCPEAAAVSQLKYSNSMAVISEELGVAHDKEVDWMKSRYARSMNAIGKVLGIKSDWK